ncbi:MAG: NAD(P)-dependent oxidoreductase [Candidatus Geothermarchaeota archaeon]
MKVLICDVVQDVLLKLLRDNNISFDYFPHIGRSELMKIIGDYEFLIVRGRTHVDKSLIDNAVKLKAIIRFGVGLDNIDVEYAKLKGIDVYNTPLAFTEAVAELTVALIIGILRNIGNAHCSMKSGRWEKQKFYGYELQNKVVGIVGFGRIGRRVAELLSPFNVKILAFDIVPIPHEYVSKGVIQVESLDDLFLNSDIITIHVPLTEKTKGMINKNLFLRATKRPFIINTSRGEVIRIDDLKWALKNHLIRGVALDVYPHEPFFDEELVSYDNVLLTPHIGAQTFESNEKAAYEVLSIIKKYIVHHHKEL